MFTKVLVANRGEIAVRIIRACRALGVATVAVYSEADRRALHVELADQAIAIGPAPATESYLRADRIIAAARQSGAEAIHPGYGFLSERAAAARACRDAGLVWVGPTPEAIALLGDKIAAKRLAESAGVPTIPGYLGDDQGGARLRAEAERVGLPLLIKASAGGGGKGMRTIERMQDFDAGLAAAQREAQAAFGEPTVFLERLIERPRHIEIQILADTYGSTVHMFERECSIQRRHQKIVEESPSPALTSDLRAAIGAAAVRLAQAAGYVNAGTVEFLLDQAGQFFFLEMNTRLQVEHPVTELVTGHDLVALQLRVASGEPLPFQQRDLRQSGHAIELRVCAEDPASFLPATGTLDLVALPPDARNECGVRAGDEVSIYYDSLLAKLIVHAATRAEAIVRLGGALDQYAVLGVLTNLPLLRAIVAHPAFVAGEMNTAFLEEHALGVAAPVVAPDLVLAAAAILEADREREQRAADPWAAGAWRHMQGGVVRRYDVGESQQVACVDRSHDGLVVSVADRAIVARVMDHAPGRLMLQVAGQIEQLHFVWNGQQLAISWRGWEHRLAPALALSVDGVGADRGRVGGHVSLVAPMPGVVIRILVEDGAAVDVQQPLVVIEAMKMEHVVAAPHAGVVRLLVASGDRVVRGAPLVDVVAGEPG